MFVTVVRGGPAVLEEIDDFRRLKVVCGVAVEERAGALAPIGRVDGDHVWIDTQWLRDHGRPDDAAWCEGFNGMVRYAGRAGWVDERGSLRAHIDVD